VSGACDRVVSLLAAAPHPMTQGELAVAFGWSKQRAAFVIAALLEAGRVIALVLPLNGHAGRPTAAYTTPARSPVPAWAHPDTVVVTPNDHEARILRALTSGHLELELLGVRPRSSALVTLHSRLVRPIQPGRERPAPVRIEPLAA